MRQAHLELAIDRLILPDLPPSQRERVAAALEAELARLWAEQGMPPGVENASSLTLNAATVQVAAGARPDEVGAQVARSIYSDLASSERLAGLGGKSTA